jgi:hypothetical protein
MGLTLTRFRSKAPSAVSLSLGQFLNRWRAGFDFLLTPYIATHPLLGDGKGEGKFQISLARLNRFGSQ